MYSLENVHFRHDATGDEKLPLLNIFRNRKKRKFVPTHFSDSDKIVEERGSNLKISALKITYPNELRW